MKYRRGKLLTICLITIFLIMNFSILAFAEDNVPFNKLPDGAIYTPSGTKGELGTGGIFIDDGSGGTTVHDDFLTLELTDKEIKPFLENTLDAIDKESKRNNSTLSTGDVYILHSMLNNFFTDSALVVRYMTEGSRADFVGARRIVSGVEPYVQIITGLIAWGAVLFFGIVTVSDIFYISIPVLHSGVMGDETGRTKKPKVVSTEAYNAVKRSLTSVGQGEQGSKQVNSLLDYLKHRTGFIIAFVLTIMLLSSGQLMSFVVSAVSSILSGLLDMIGLS